MPWEPQRQRLRTTAPALAALQVMGRTAHAAADTVAFREWASRLATRAPPRDYVAQLRELWDGILKRWRYVAEQGEWVHGTPRSLIAHVLGVKYNTTTDPTIADIDRTPAKEKGFGDCDDIATVVAAGALALGMTPYWRVSFPPAHVAVTVKTPRGDLVNIDPVGHPEHPFGWKAPARNVFYFDLGAHPVQSLGNVGGNAMNALPQCSYFHGTDGAPNSTTPIHWARVPYGDVGGPRCLAVPDRALRLMRRGYVLDGCPGIDELGNVYEYDAGRDLWQANMGRTFRQRFRGRRKKRVARRRRVVKRIGKAIRTVGRKIIGPILSAPWAQKLVGAALRVVGVPSQLTQRVMNVAGTIIKEKGIVGFVRMLRSNPRKAAQLAAAAARLRGLQGLGGGYLGALHDGGPCQHAVTQDGVTFPGQQILGFVGLPFGELDVSETPDPGRWYRVKKKIDERGLLDLAGRAYKTTKNKYTFAKWIANAKANAPTIKPGTEDNLFPNGKPSFRPIFACEPERAIQGEPGNCYALLWIPQAEGDEPTEDPGPAIPEPLPDLPEPPPIDAQELPPEPPPVIVVDEAPAPPPEPEPVKPIAQPVPPVEPIPAPAEPDHPEPPPPGGDEITYGPEPTPLAPTRTGDSEVKHHRGHTILVSYEPDLGSYKAYITDGIVTTGRRPADLTFFAQSGAQAFTNAAAAIDRWYPSIPAPAPTPAPMPAPMPAPGPSMTPEQPVIELEPMLEPTPAPMPTPTPQYMPPPSQNGKGKEIPMLAVLALLASQRGGGLF